MELQFDQEALRYYARLLDAEFSQEETADVIVPDTLPDVVSVTEADAGVWLRSKEVAEGRVSFTGTVSGAVLYSGAEGEALCRMPAQLDFTAHYDSPAIGRDSLCALRLDLAGFEARIINSRKLLLRAEILVGLSVFAQREERCVAAVTGAPLELREESLSPRLLCSVTERSFTAAEDLNLPSSKPRIREVLKQRVSLAVEEVVPGGGKLAARCRARVAILYKSWQGELCRAEFSFPFSQLCDAAAGEEPDSAGADLSLTGVWLEPVFSGEEGAEQLRAELGVAACFYAWRETPVRCVTDLYSLAYPLEAETETLSLQSMVRGREEEESLTVTLPTGESVREILSVSLRPGRAFEGEGGRRRMLSLRVLFETDGGGLSTAVGSAELPEPEGGSACFRVGEITARTVAEGVELRLPILRQPWREELLCLTVPVTAALDETNPRDLAALPSLVALYGDGSRDLWDVAKTFASTRAAIREANPDLSGEVPAPGELLLVPRVRAVGKREQK